MGLRKLFSGALAVAVTTMGMTLATALPANAAPETACKAASNPGGLYIGSSHRNSGAPNFVPAACRSIWMKLTEVHYITYAKACLEYSSGRNYRCGPWVYLEDNGAWNRLLPTVHPGDQWQLYLSAKGRGYVGFDFSG